jgi:adenosylcobinamide-GDP ribazoletransferase
MTGGLGFAQAFRTLTIIPVPGRDAGNASTQLYFYPFVGLFTGALGAGALYAVQKCMTVTGGMALVLGVMWACYMAFITRGFHLDGLGDMADGFGGGWTRERRLEIMKDSRSGSFAIVAIALCLLLKSASAGAAIQKTELLSLLWSVFIARVQVVLMCAVCSYAKDSGLSYELVSEAGVSHLLSAVLQAGLLGFGIWYMFGICKCLLIIPAIVSTISMIVLAMVSRRRIGGVTGDVLGACCEICEVLALSSSIFVK